jgi:hypothetical protein
MYQVLFINKDGDCRLDHVAHPTMSEVVDFALKELSNRESGTTFKVVKVVEWHAEPY